MAIADLPRSIVFLDVETTGLTHDDRIVSLGALRVDTATLGQREPSINALHYIFNPGCPSHPAARRVHGYADDLLAWQEPFAAHADKVHSLLEGADLFVAHNASFDFGFVERDLRLAGRRLPNRSIFCTMQHHRLTGSGSASLNAVAARYGLTRTSEHHGAAEDAWLAMLIFLNQHGMATREPFPVDRLGTPINLRSSAPPSSDEPDRSWFDKLLGIRHEPPLRPPPGLTTAAPSFDIDDEPETEESVDLDDLSVGISYVDAAGQASERTIRCHALRLDGGQVYLDAWCLLRKGERSFRLDRIREVTDYTTGEIIDDVARFFSGYIPTGWPDPWARASARRPPVDTASTKLFQDGVKVLMYLAMEDGSLHEAEHRLILNYAMGRLREAGIADFDLEARSSQWIRNHVPTRRSAVIALGKLMADPEHSRDIAHKIVDVILADGHASDEEMAAAWALVEAMERKERRK